MKVEEILKIVIIAFLIIFVFKIVLNSNLIEGAEGDRCRKDKNCNNSEICVGRVCVKENRECAGGDNVCQPQGRVCNKRLKKCVNRRNPNPPPIPPDPDYPSRCRKDKDCKNSEICEANVCVEDIRKCAGGDYVCQPQGRVCNKWLKQCVNRRHPNPPPHTPTDPKKFYCNKQNGKCNALKKSYYEIPAIKKMYSGRGYDLENICDSNCGKSPPPIPADPDRPNGFRTKQYHCNKQTGKCDRFQKSYLDEHPMIKKMYSGRGYDLENICDSNCGKSPPPGFIDRHSCKNGECVFDPNSNYTKEQCKQSCYPGGYNPPPPPNLPIDPKIQDGLYYCNTYNGGCDKVHDAHFLNNPALARTYPGFGFQNAADCKFSCKKQPPGPAPNTLKYRCNEKKGRCEQNDSGGYDSEKDCSMDCGKRWECNKTSKRCERGDVSSSKYVSKLGCQQYTECGKPDVNDVCPNAVEGAVLKDDYTNCIHFIGKKECSESIIKDIHGKYNWCKWNSKEDGRQDVCSNEDCGTPGPPSSPSPGPPSPSPGPPSPSPGPPSPPSPSPGPPSPSPGPPSPSPGPPSPSPGPPSPSPGPPSPSPGPPPKPPSPPTPSPGPPPKPPSPPTPSPGPPKPDDVVPPSPPSPPSPKPTPCPTETIKNCKYGKKEPTPLCGGGGYPECKEETCCISKNLTCSKGKYGGDYKFPCTDGTILNPNTICPGDKCSQDVCCTPKPAPKPAPAPSPAPTPGRPTKNCRSKKGKYQITPQQWQWDTFIKYDYYKANEEACLCNPHQGNSFMCLAKTNTNSGRNGHTCIPARDSDGNPYGYCPEFTNP
jgi:hypothetical protein